MSTETSDGGIEWVWGGNAHCLSGYIALVPVHLIKLSGILAIPARITAQTNPHCWWLGEIEAVRGSALTDFMQMSRLLGPQMHEMPV